MSQPGNERELAHEEFITPYRDLARARTLRDSLRTLAGGGAGAALQEMARDVLDGRIGLREAVRAPAYAEALGERVAEARRAWERIPAEERERQLEAARVARRER